MIYWIAAVVVAAVTGFLAGTWVVERLIAFKLIRDYPKIAADLAAAAQLESRPEEKAD